LLAFASARRRQRPKLDPTQGRIERYNDQIKAFFDSIDPSATLNKATGESAHGGKADVSAAFHDVAV